MKLMNYRQGHQTRLGIYTGNGIIDVQRGSTALDLDTPLTMEEVLDQGAAGIERLSLMLGKELAEVPIEDLRVAPVIERPGKIICIGLNYRRHAAETGAPEPDFPVVFSKYGNALAAHEQSIPIPEWVRECDYEAELVAVVGRRAGCVAEAEALSYIAGYTVGNDVSARDLQFRSSQWLLGKSCDGFAPVGPFLVTADEVDPQNLEISCTVNGEQRQRSNTGDMIFPVAKLVSLLSHCMTLEPGDLIFTGTPEGVILGRRPEDRVWLKAGDQVCVTIEGLGTLCNRME